MKANEFVKKFGWREAQKCLPYCSKRGDFIYYKNIEVNFNELKRIVESHELVEGYGGIKKAKSDTGFPTCFGDNDFFREVTLKKALADVESCS